MVPDMTNSNHSTAVMLVGLMLACLVVYLVYLVYIARARAISVWARVVPPAIMIALWLILARNVVS